MPADVTITLPDGTQKTAASGTLAAKVDGELVDLSRTLDHNLKLEVVTPKIPEAVEIARHDGQQDKVRLAAEGHRRQVNTAVRTSEDACRARGVVGDPLEARRLGD